MTTVHGIETETDCAHLTVTLEPFFCDACGEPHGCWECAECGEEFVLAEEAEEMYEQRQKMAEALRALTADADRLRAIVVLGGVFVLGMLVGRR